MPPPQTAPDRGLQLAHIQALCLAFLEFECLPSSEALLSVLSSDPEVPRVPSESREGFKISPDLLLLLEVHATNQPAYHPWGHDP